MEEKKILDDLQKAFPNRILKTSAPFGDETVVIKKEALLDIVNFLRKKPYQYAMLLDLTCVDHPGRTDRFEMVYHIYSLALNRRLRIKLSVPESAAVVASLTPLWKNASWLEREAYDMFGVRFEGHPDLRRLFMYEGFEGHPLRKDYPLRRRQPRIPLRNEP
jgi:NADH-quinone oxidoreductase subunit C